MAKRPIPAILECLATSEGQPMNKYRIEEQTGLSRQSLYNAVRTIKHLGWIRVAATDTSRTGLPSERYVLTDLGYYRAAILNPHLEAKVRQLLGHKFEEIQEKDKRGHTIHVDELLAMIRNMMISRKARPNYKAQLTIAADDDGRVGWRWTTLA